MNVHLDIDDMKFLQELCVKLNTQDNRSTRNPIAYCIREKIRVITAEGYEDGTMIWDSEGNTIYDDDSKEDWMNFLAEDQSINWNWIHNFQDLLDMLEDNSEFSYGYYKITERLNPNIFLTEEAVNKHIKSNYYHYDTDADNYVIHLWRNPEIERLLNIIFKITGIEDRRG